MFILLPVLVFTISLPRKKSPKDEVLFKISNDELEKIVVIDYEVIQTIEDEMLRALINSYLDCFHNFSDLLTNAVSQYFTEIPALDVDFEPKNIQMVRPTMLSRMTINNQDNLEIAVNLPKLGKKRQRHELEECKLDQISKEIRLQVPGKKIVANNLKQKCKQERNLTSTRKARIEREKSRHTRMNHNNDSSDSDSTCQTLTPGLCSVQLGLNLVQEELNNLKQKVDSLLEKFDDHVIKRPNTLDLMSQKKTFIFGDNDDRGQLIDDAEDMHYNNTCINSSTMEESETYMSANEYVSSAGKMSTEQEDETRIPKLTNSNLNHYPASSDNNIDQFYPYTQRSEIKWDLACDNKQYRDILNRPVKKLLLSSSTCEAELGHQNVFDSNYHPLDDHYSKEHANLTSERDIFGKHSRNISYTDEDESLDALVNRAGDVERTVELYQRNKSGGFLEPYFSSHLENADSEECVKGDSSPVAKNLDALKDADIMENGEVKLGYGSNGNRRVGTESVQGLSQDIDKVMRTARVEKLPGDETALLLGVNKLVPAVYELVSAIGSKESFVPKGVVEPVRPFQMIQVDKKKSCGESNDNFEGNNGTVYNQKLEKKQLIAQPDVARNASAELENGYKPQSIMSNLCDSSNVHGQSVIFGIDEAFNADQRVYSPSEIPERQVFFDNVVAESKEASAKLPTLNLHYSSELVPGISPDSENEYDIFTHGSSLASQLQDVSENVSSIHEQSIRYGSRLPTTAVPIGVNSVHQVPLGSFLSYTEAGINSPFSIYTPSYHSLHTDSEDSSRYHSTKSPDEYSRTNFDEGDAKCDYTNASNDNIVQEPAVSSDDVENFLTDDSLTCMDNSPPQNTISEPIESLCNNEGMISDNASKRSSDLLYQEQPESNDGNDDPSMHGRRPSLTIR
ncbi:hypothetical protein THOM_1597 [Trachipleistophora hominis]|uniref:Uncharacterized protein n=1 Tax=Trachipleistophora hominis TaxID=72359 RepID=L7JWM1_TRAHO|nr:hypothetical protein THOM_1597 [Trachipleistophora hominis]